MRCMIRAAMIIIVIIKSVIAVIIPSPIPTIFDKYRLQFLSLKKQFQVTQCAKRKQLYMVKIHL